MASFLLCYHGNEVNKQSCSGQSCHHCELPLAQAVKSAPGAMSPLFAWCTGLRCRLRGHPGWEPPAPPASGGSSLAPYFQKRGTSPLKPGIASISLMSSSSHPRVRCPPCQRQSASQKVSPQTLCLSKSLASVWWQS